MALSGPIVAEVAFCQITDAIGVNRGSGVSLTHFGHAALSPNYSDEVGTERSAGVGVNVDNFIGAVDGDQLEIGTAPVFQASSTTRRWPGDRARILHPDRPGH